jgi:Sec-independent protein translocase protein TatA
MSLSEMLFLALLGLAIFGPKKLVEIAQQGGKALARLKEVSREFQSQLATDVSATANDMKMRQALAEVGLVETALIQAHVLQAHVLQGEMDE